MNYLYNCITGCTILTKKETINNILPIPNNSKYLIHDHWIGIMVSLKGKMEYIGINAWFFLIVNLLKIPLQIFVWDNITYDTFALNLIMIPIIGIGAWLGIRIVHLFPEKAFRRFIQVVTILSVIMMLVN